MISKLDRNIWKVNAFITSRDKINYSLKDIEDLLQEMKRKDLIGQRCTAQELFNKIDPKILSVENFTRNNTPIITRYLTKPIDDLVLIQSIVKNSYFSHGTALSIHDTGTCSERKIYLAVDQIEEKKAKNNDLTQKEIDESFAKPQRIASEIYNWKDYSIYLLHKKSRKPTTTISQNSKYNIAVTDLEKTILDITVRPAYANGPRKVLEAYQKFKNNLNTEKLLKYLIDSDFIYPYGQAIGFYLENAGYIPEQILPFKMLNKKYKFYLDYAIDDKKHCSTWNIIYPEKLLKK